LFLSDRAVAVAGTCVTVTIEGRRALVTEVQTLVHRSTGPAPRRTVSDLDAARVGMVLAVLARHAKLRELADHDVYAATVGGLAAREPAADLAVALAVTSAELDEPIPSTVCAIGEVSLSGDVRRVGALQRRLAEAARLGFTTALVPRAHDGDPLGPGAAGIRTVPVETVSDAVAAVRNLGRYASRDARRATLRSLDGGREALAKSSL
jgi:DNA repair protein RadA/Sms